MISFSRIKNKRPFFVSRIQRKEVGHTDTDTDTIVSALGERGGRHAVALTSPVFLVVPVYRQKTFWQIGKGRDGREQKEENNWEYTHGVLYVCNDIVVGKEREGNTKTYKEEEEKVTQATTGIFSPSRLISPAFVCLVCVCVCAFGGYIHSAFRIRWSRLFDRYKRLLPGHDARGTDGGERRQSHGDWLLSVLWQYTVHSTYTERDRECGRAG